ncbi:MAG TPA: acyclic terpene utilization AtuA family protein [Casimicrobiaceae bacterium]|nr:acyclic terpene utilization AtuA family protein [Casimicrobiaceae bacterium]
MERGLRIGSGAGFQGDRLDPALVLAERGQLDYLGLECLGERTIALAQLRRRKDPSKGYDPLLERRMARLLPLTKRHGIKLVTNMGAANPLAAADAILGIAREHNLAVKVAVVTGDDVLDQIRNDAPTIEARGTLADYGEPISANAYLGTAALLPALQSGADVVITGRVADPSLFLAPIAYRFGWSLDDYDRLACGTCVGHLLECAGQLTGGYFADPGRKDVTNMAWLGFPFADVDADGAAIVGKVEGTGGAISLANTKEQLLYEVTDPHAYLTPDVVADFSRVTLREVAPQRIAISGARGRGRPAQLKVSVGYHAGFVGEGEIGYAGPNAVARARLAGEIVRERLEGQFSEMRIDLIGSTSLHGRAFDRDENPYEVRLRVAARAKTSELAMIVGEEVEALYTNGPAGGGGTRKYVNEQIGIVSTLIDREQVQSRVTVREWSPHAETV